MQGFLEWLDVLALHIRLAIVAKRPNASHIWVGVLQPKKVLPAYPPALIPIFAIHRIDKQLRNVRQVVADKLLILAAQHRHMGYAAPTCKKVVKVFSPRQHRNDLQ